MKLSCSLTRESVVEGRVAKLSYMGPLTPKGVSNSLSGHLELSHGVSAAFSQGGYRIDQVRRGMAQHGSRRFIGKVIWEVEKGSERARRGNFEKISQLMLACYTTVWYINNNS
jgi:hypothetical protein